MCKEGSLAIMDGLLPPSMMSGGSKQRTDGAPHAPPRARVGEGQDDGGSTHYSNDCGTVEVYWCGNPLSILAVSIDGGLADTWIPGDMGVTFKHSLEPGEHSIRVEDGDKVVLHECFVIDRGVGGVASSPVVKQLQAGLPYVEAVVDPQGRSQFSFEGGRSACTFLVVEGAMRMERLARCTSARGGEGMVTGADIQAVLDVGMSRYLDEGGRDCLAAMGLEHANVCEVLQHFAAYGDKWRADEGETYWGSLMDPESVESALTQLEEQGRPEGGAVACLTRPPESVLVVCREKDGLFGVLDTHMRWGVSLDS